jgi:hypothetical protein
MSKELAALVYSLFHLKRSTHLASECHGGCDEELFLVQPDRRFHSSQM